MSPSRHRAARPALRVRVSRLAVPAALATALTGAVVSVGLATADADTHVFTAEKAALKIELPSTSERKRSASRSAPQVALDPAPVGKKFATAELNLWARATDASKQVGTIEAGSQVQVTGEVVGDWAEVLVKDQVRYVNAKYLSTEKPDSLALTAGISGAPCPDGSATEHGLTAGAVRMYRAVCAAFPALSHYGGWDAHGEHSSGKAIDFMIDGNSALGRALADWLRAHARELNLYDVIYAQHIYTQQRGGEGWRAMPNRGSATANHFDHVHASVY